MGEPVDVVLDVLGGPAFADNLAVLAPRGRLVLLGFLAGGRTTGDLGPILRKRLEVIGTRDADPHAGGAGAAGAGVHRAHAAAVRPADRALRAAPAGARAGLPDGRAGRGAPALESNETFGKVVVTWDAGHAGGPPGPFCRARQGSTDWRDIPTHPALRGPSARRRAASRLVRYLHSSPRPAADVGRRPHHFLEETMRHRPIATLAAMLTAASRRSPPRSRPARQQPSDPRHRPRSARHRYRHPEAEPGHRHARLGANGARPGAPPHAGRDRADRLAQDQLDHDRKATPCDTALINRELATVTHDRKQLDQDLDRDRKEAAREDKIERRVEQESDAAIDAHHDLGRDRAKSSASKPSAPKSSAKTTKR